MATRAEIHANFRFTVAIDGYEQGAFTECKLPTLQIETQDIKEGGQNNFIHKRPVRVKPGTVTVKHGITKNDELLKWYVDLAGAMQTGNFQQDVERTVTITMYDVKRTPLATFRFERAYPVKWVGPTLKTDGKAIAVDEIEFAHHGFEVS